MLLPACLSDKVVAPLVPENCDTLRGITYTKDIKPIYDANCNTSGCHNARDFRMTGGYNLSDYDNASGNTNETLLCAINRTGCQPMPKGGAKLSACTIKKIQTWADSGFAQ